MLRSFVGRADVCAVYERTGYRRAGPITDRLLRSHLSGELSVATYLAAPGAGTNKLVIDIDRDDRALVEDVLAKLPRGATFVERTGGRGWHIWIMLDQMYPVRIAKPYLEELLDLSGVEVFPKSDVPVGGTGSPIRLPGGIHPRGGASKLYDHDFNEVPVDLESQLHIIPMPIALGKWPCISLLEQGVAEGMRDMALFALALFYRDRGLSPELIHQALLRVNERCDPPLDERTVWRKVVSAMASTAKLGCSNEALQWVCPGSCRFKPRAEVWSVEQLLSTTFDRTWCVEGLLSEGLTILAGRPKLGKSWLCLQLALAVARGEPFLDMNTKAGKVLYLALEDSPARLQYRLQCLEAQAEPVDFIFDFPRIDRNIAGLGEIMAGYNMVILDSLARLKSTDKEELSAEDMEEILRPLQRLGYDLHIPVVIVHHHRKSTSRDPVWDVRGSGALGGVADLIVGMYQDDDLYEFVAIGKDIESKYLQIERRHGIWRIT